MELEEAIATVRVNAPFVMSLDVTCKKKDQSLISPDLHIALSKCLTALLRGEIRITEAPRKKIRLADNMKLLDDIL